MKTSGIHSCSSGDYFSLVDYSTLTMIHFPNTLTAQTRVLSCTRESFVTDAMLVSRRVKSQKFKMLNLVPRVSLLCLPTTTREAEKRENEVASCCIFLKTKDAIGMEMCEKI